MKNSYLYKGASWALIVITVFNVFACRTTRKQANEKPIKFTVLQINDVYEIAPLEGGTAGGLARVATFKKELQKETPNVFFFIAGDFLSPSAIGNVDYKGKKIRGAQMVEVLNAAGLDYAVFGNHEFDLPENDLQNRINESKFAWFSSNVVRNLENKSEPFAKMLPGGKKYFPSAVVLNVKDETMEKSVRVGLFSVTLDANKAKYVRYLSPVERAKYYYDSLSKVCDCVVAVTHQNLPEDLKMAAELPNLALMMGGHEHQNMYHRVGNVPVAKADANAKTVYVHRFLWDGKKCKVESELKKITPALKDDKAVAAKVEIWQKRAYEGFVTSGFDPDEKITQFNTPYDGTEASVRNQSTNLGELIARAMRAASPGTEAAFYNSGSIRLDDKLLGVITQYDVLRTLPFGGKIVSVTLKGELLLQIMDASLKNKGSGGFLQTDVITFDQTKGSWLLDGKPIEKDREYKIATSEFLFSGAERNLSFFTSKNAQVVNMDAPTAPGDPRRDIRLVVIEYLKKMKP